MKATGNHSSGWSLYWDGLSNQMKGTVISLIGVSILTTDTFLISSVSDVPNFTLQFYRYLFAGISVLIALLLILRRSFIDRLRNIGRIQILASISFLLANLFFTMAVLSTSAANVLVCQGINPLFSAFFSYILSKETIPKRTLIACVICLGAILWIFAAESKDANGSRMEGNLYAVLSSLLAGESFSLFRLASQIDRCDDIDIAFIPMIAYFGNALVSLMIGSPLARVTSIDMMYLCIQGIETTLSFGLLTIAPSYIASSEVMLFMLIETVLGPVWVWLGGFGRPPIATVYGGIILVVTLCAHSIVGIIEEQKHAKRDTSSSTKAEIT